MNIPFTFRHLERESPQEEQKSAFSFRPVSKTQEKLSEEQEFPLEKEIERSQAQLTSRGLETVLGAPGDLLNFVSSMTGIPGENLLPTSQSLRKKSKELSRGYTSPKSEFEEKGGELFQDVIAMGFPGSGQYGFLRNLGIPLVANLVKEGISDLGGEDKASQYGKIGTMVFLDLIGHRQGLGMGGAKKYAGSLFEKAQKAIPEGTLVDASSLETSLSKLQKNLERGGTAPSTAPALTKIKEIKDKIKNGQIEAQELVESRKRINEIIEAGGGFEVYLPKHVKAKTISNLHDVKNETVKALNEWGDKFNPEFSKLNRNANEAWAAYQQSNKISNFIKDKLKRPLKSTGAKILFNSALAGGGLALPTLGKAGVIASGAGAPFYMSYKYIDRMRKSPTLRKYYQEVVSSALKGNAAQFNQNMDRFDKQMANEEAAFSLLKD